MKDWTGNKKSIFVCNGATNHSDSEREERDFYATDPIAVRKLCEVEHFDHAIWECACVRTRAFVGRIGKATLQSVFFGHCRPWLSAYVCLRFLVAVVRKQIAL